MHLRFDGQGAADADRRSAAHVAGKLVGARRQPDLVDRAVGDSCCEIVHGAHRDFAQYYPLVAQMPAVQHEERYVGRGPRGSSC